MPNEERPVVVSFDLSNAHSQSIGGKSPREHPYFIIIKIVDGGKTHHLAMRFADYQQATIKVGQTVHGNLLTKETIK